MNADGSTGRPAQVGLGHELGHAKDGVEGKNTDVNYNDIKSVKANADIVEDPDNGYSRSYMNKSEYNDRVNIDNPIRKEQGAKLRAVPILVP